MLLCCNREYLIPYARVCDTKNTIVNEYIPWATETTGLWIDINPVDGIMRDIASIEVSFMVRDFAVAW